MLNVDIPSRPFACEPLTGLMLPDGFFEVALGAQSLNIQVRNVGAATVPGLQVYVESVDDPGIVVTPATRTLGNATSGASSLASWDANFAGATPGVHRVSFVLQSGTEIRRVIKKIFVTRIGFDPATGTFSAATPEGVIQVAFLDMVRPARAGCGCGCGDKDKKPEERTRHGSDVITALRQGLRGHSTDFRLCVPEYLPLRISAAVTPTPPFAGQYGDLPFDDPWWKVLLCILAFLLLIAAAIAEAVDGSGSVSTTGGPGGAGSPTGPCCGLAPSGGGTSYVAAGLLAAAAAAALAAALSDARDPFRRGQDHTMPADGALTVGERLDVELSYGEAVALGKPFAVGAKWQYHRATTAGTLTHGDSDLTANIHTLSHYEIEAPDVVRTYQREMFLVRGRFFEGKEALRGDQLVVQCFLCGPAGEFVRFTLQDDGQGADEKPNDGWYSGQIRFSPKQKGLWTYFVIAQDVNHATPDLKPEEAAQIIGGFVRTHQLTISFDEGECALVPDGHVNVV